MANEKLVLSTQQRGGLLMASKKLNIQKMKILASGPISLWQIDGGKVETVSGRIFYLWAPKSMQT